MEKELVSYIQEAWQHGLSDIEIKQNLLNTGWEADLVEESFVHAKALENKASLEPAPSVTPSPVVPPNEEPAPAPSPSFVLKSPHTEVSISDKHFTSQKLAFYKRPVFYLLCAICVVLLGGGGYLFYTTSFASQEKIWDGFLALPKARVYENNFEWSYQDNGTLERDDTSYQLELRNFRLGLSGDYYVNTSDLENPQLFSDVKYSFGSGTMDFGMGFKYSVINKSFYLNISENPVLDMVFNSYQDGDKRFDWLKIDLEELAKNAEEGRDGQEGERLREIFSDEFVGELRKMWDDANLVQVTEYVGMEKIGNERVARFKNSFDKTAFRSLVFSYVDKIAARYEENGETIEDKDIQLVKVAVEEILNRIEIKEFETWIGVKDFQLYQVKIVSNAPSVLSMVKQSNIEGPLDSARSKSRDAKRLADMRQLASALELYYNDFGKYPLSKDGVPEGLAPNYIGTMPVAPIPADGMCSEYHNTYWYEALEDGQRYTYGFCLGQAAGGYNSGRAVLSEAGIQSGIPCDANDINCAALPSQVSSDDVQRVKDYIAKIDFNGEIRVHSRYSNFGVVKELAKPAEYFDFLQALKEREARYRNLYNSLPSDSGLVTARSMFRDVLNVFQ